MSDHQVTNHLVQDLKSKGVEVDHKGLKSLASTPFLFGAAHSLRSIEKASHEVQTGSQDTDNEAIGYGALVKAKLELYKIQQEYVELQKMLSTITKGMFNLTKSLAKGVSESTQAAMDSEADQLQTQAYGNFASGFSQILIFGGGHFIANGAANREMSKMTAENEQLEEMHSVYTDTPQAEGSVTTRTEEEQKAFEATPEGKRIKELKQGKIERNERNQVLFDKEAEQKAASMASEDERTAIREKVRKQIETNENRKNTLSHKQNSYANYMQIGSNISTSFSQGIAQTVQANQKNEQADEEANKAAIQVAQNNINPAEGSKLMDEYAKEAISTLETIKNIERGNKYEPSR